jgi:hypothetical protein
MTWRIIKQGWENADSLCDTRLPITYLYQELDGAKFVTANDEGEVCFMLADGRTAWLVSTDLEVVYPLADGYLREESEDKTDGEVMDELIAITQTDGEKATDTECLEQAYALLKEWSQRQKGNE